MTLNERISDSHIHANGWPALAIIGFAIIGFIWSLIWIGSLFFGY